MEWECTDITDKNPDEEIFVKTVMKMKIGFCEEIGKDTATQYVEYYWE